MPVGNPFSDLFAKSPIRPIQRHMAVAHEAAEKLLPFLQAAVAGDWNAARSLRGEIVALEQEGDRMKKNIRLSLPRSLFLPVPRSDLLDLLTMQDKIPNAVEDVTGLMLRRRMRFPKPMRASLLEYGAACVAASAQAQRAIEELDELLEVGFSGREVEIVEGMIKELDRIEGIADDRAEDFYARLYDVEKELPPVDAMFMYRAIELLGSIADAAERVGHRLQILIAR
jgi:predicted phosphate transport protein (TIGR00153 family)